MNVPAGKLDLFIIDGEMNVPAGKAGLYMSQLTLIMGAVS
jgi:hypothetical protein